MTLPLEPDVAAALAMVLQAVPRERQPLLIALAERMAADRYRAWADDPAYARQRDALRACAAREEEIAARIEALYPDAAAVQEALRADVDLDGVTRGLFADRPVPAQLATQARGERLGAATWRAFARHAPPAARATLLACAELEEASAAVLESILAAADR